MSDYWPGAPAGSMKCACGVNRTCANPGLACNCDIGDEKWREDEGRPQYASSPYRTLFISYGTSKENLSNNQEVIEVIIISFILKT